MTSDVSRILWLYYNDPVSSLSPVLISGNFLFYSHLTLFAFCAGNELFFVALYLMKWNHSPTELAMFGTWTWPQVLAIVTFPFCFTKNVINIVQLWKASKILVGVDLAEREKAREEAEVLRHQQKK